ncbi:MAG: zinc-finger-containing protein [Xanthobacteraceae bacterium]
MNCSYCGRETEWVPNKEVYGRNYGKSYMIWLCRPCDAYVGCHNNTRQPKGSFANKELRRARRRAHAVIDPLWLSGKYKRKTVYIRLQEAFGHCVHIGESDAAKCEEIIETAKLIFSPTEV